MSQKMSPNQREVIGAISTVTGRYEALNSTNGALNTTGGGGSGGTQYIEGATTSPATGNVSLGRYNTTPPTLTNGQLYGLQLDGSGNLKVTGSLSVGGTTDNSAFTAGTSTGTPAMGFYHSTIDTVTDGRAATIGMTSKRAMFVNLNNASGAEIATSSNPLRTDPTGTTTQPVSGSVTVTQATGTNLHAVIDSGSVTATAVALPAAPKFGQASVTTTVAALASNALVNGVIIESLSTNTVSVFVGGTGVTASTGIELLPGGSTSVAVSNTNAIGVITASGTATVSFIGS